MSPDALCLVGLQQKGYNLCHLISYFVNIDCFNPKDYLLRAQKLCGSRGGRPGRP